LLLGSTLLLLLLLLLGVACCLLRSSAITVAITTSCGHCKKWREILLIAEKLTYML
jgi:hypothetical protein